MKRRRSGCSPKQDENRRAARRVMPLTTPLGVGTMTTLNAASSRPHRRAGLLQSLDRRLPTRPTAADRAVGYTHRLALQQGDVSLTQVFARPVQGRHFFEAVIRDNLDLGPPDPSACRFRFAPPTPPRRPGAIGPA